MIDTQSQLTQLETVLSTIQLPDALHIRCWRADDMPTIQSLSDQQGWPTHHTPEEVLASWSNAWPALVASKDEHVVGYARGLTDQQVITHITDLLVDSNYRGQGIGRLLLDVCQRLYPRTDLVLVAEKLAIPFYTTIGFRYTGEAYARGSTK